MTPPPAPTMAAPAPSTTGAPLGRRRHVLLFPLPFQSHINPMFRLAGLLHARGFAVTVFHTGFNAPDPAQHPAYRLVPVPVGVSGSNPVPDDIAEAVSRIVAFADACGAALRERLTTVLQEYSSKDDDVACLIADAHLLPVVRVTNQLGLPALALRTGSAASYTSLAAYPMLCEKATSLYKDVVQSRRDELVPELPPYRVRDLMWFGEAGHGLLPELRELMARVVATAKASSSLIINTFDALERQELANVRRGLSVPVFDVGPLHMFAPDADSSLLRQDRSCLDWLDAQATDSVVYVSFGSAAIISERDLVETAWGLADSGVPFLWVVPPGLVRGRAQHLPDGFEAATRGRGVTVALAPQEEVLRHRAVGGFWTHNGWNSTTEGLCAGVPMLCRPCFGDQMGNARYVEHVWRVGFEVDGELERGTVKAAIRRIMAECDGGKMRARASEMKKAAAESTGKDGSSCLAIDKLVKHIMSL